MIERSLGCLGFTTWRAHTSSEEHTPMSCTGQALSNARLLAHGNDISGAKYWALRAVELMPSDLKLPRHVQARTGTVSTLVELHCRRCDAAEVAPTLAQAGAFRDRHWYCNDERGAAVSGCPACGRLAFRWEPACRFCGSAGLKPKRRRVPVADVLAKRATYKITRANGDVVAQISCGGMRQAKAAGRALFPHERLEVAICEQG
jgi:hypothetical protein